MIDSRKVRTLSQRYYRRLLQTVANSDSNYGESFEENYIKEMDVYSQGTNEKIGTVRDILVDDQGRFIYLVKEICHKINDSAIALLQ